MSTAKHNLTSASAPGVAVIVAATVALSVLSSFAKPLPVTSQSQEPSAAAPKTAATPVAISQEPSLAVGIIVEGLKLENVEQLRPLLGKGGLLRLLEQGVVVPDLDFGTPLDGAAATAMLLTGASPWVNGIAADTRFNTDTKRPEPTYTDATVIGNFTDQTLSPVALRVTTLADEVRRAGGGTAYAYAIAPDAATALALAGHVGNSGVWVDDATGRWASSTAYRDLPPVIQTVNHRSALEYRLDTLQWTPSVDINRLPSLPAHKKLYPFRHIFTRGDLNRYRAYKNSPAATADVTSMAGEYLRTLNLGRREGSLDFLGLGYSLESWSYGREADGRAEDMDALLRLDRSLEQLFASIDSQGPGMDHTVVFLAGTPISRRQRRDDDSLGTLPGGELSSRKAVGLLNMYLMALYGNGQWVAGYHDGQIFLNQKAISERGKELTAIRREAAQFMRRMAGVADAWSIDDIAAGTALTANPQAQRRNLCLATAGDVLVDILPGWTEVDDDDDTASEPTRAMRSTTATAPAFIMAPTLAPQTLSTPVDARLLAPTVASILRIRSPNGAAMAPLRLQRK